MYMYSTEIFEEILFSYHEMFKRILRLSLNCWIFVNFVYSYEGWVAGYQAAYDTSKSKLIANNFSLGYRSDDFQVHSAV